jgi:hypothetical protein
MKKHYVLSVRLIGSVLACLGICLLAVQLSLAQVAVSVLNGTVTDPSGASIPNAQIAIRSSSQGFTRIVQSSATGAFSVPDLPPGVYTVSVDAAGFKKAVVEELTLYVGQVTTQNFHLEVGTATQTVSVNAEAALLNTTNGELGTVITNTSITQLPLNGRNFIQLNLLSPGAITDKTGNTSAAVSLSPAAATFSVNGQMSDYNLYLLDGLEIKDWEAGTSMFEPSVDAVEEFQTTSSNYSAQFGAEAAAQVNLLIKSGTNQLHGTAFEYIRNNDLDAKNFFQPVGTVAPFRRNQFGGNIGGPVVKNKTFFFFNYEGFRQSLSVPETSYFPTPSELAGNLNPLIPAGQTLTNPFTGQPFPGNIIPANMIRPATLEGFLTNGIGKGPWIPVPNANLPGIDYVINSPSDYTQNQYIARVDQNLTDKTSFYGHFTWEKESRIDPNPTPSWYETEGTQTWTAAGHLVHNFTPNLLFDVGAGYTHFIQNEVQSTAGKNNITNAILQIQGNATIPGSWGAPVWDVAGFGNLGETNFGPRQWSVNITDVRPSFSWAKNKHNIHFGMDVQRVQEEVQEIFRTNGIWNYDGEFSGNSLGDFLLGLPNNINSSPDPFAPNLWNTTLGPYFQDDWKVTPRLTLNLGMRYEWVGIPLSHNHRNISNIYFPPNNGVPELVVADDAGPIVFDGVPTTLFTGVPFVRASSVGMPEALAYNDNTDFSPRLGFAYALPGTQSTVLRGGYGVFYAEDIQDKWTESAVNPPFVRSDLTVLDSTNFQTFDPSNPYVYAAASAAQIFGNQINHRMGRTQEWNLTLERTQWNTLFSVAYVGNNSDHLPDLEDPNQAVPGSGSVESRREWPTQGVLYVGGEHASANYNGLQLKAQRKFTNGLEFLASYTWSKTLDNSDGTFVGEGGRGFDSQNLLDPTSEYSYAAQDVPQTFTVSYIYELPFGTSKKFLNHGVAAAVLGGWQVNGITRVISGSPFTVSQASNGANTDVGDFYPNVIGNAKLSNPTVGEFFNTAAFAVNGPVNGVYSWGNSPRNGVFGPGTVDSDFSLSKNIHIKERGLIQFRTEVFNIFNHPIFAQPNAVLGTASFGTLTSTAIDNREIQFALRLSF